MIIKMIGMVSVILHQEWIDYLKERIFIILILVLMLNQKGVMFILNEEQDKWLKKGYI